MSGSVRRRSGGNKKEMNDKYVEEAGIITGTMKLNNLIQLSGTSGKTLKESVVDIELDEHVKNQMVVTAQYTVCTGVRACEVTREHGLGLNDSAETTEEHSRDRSQCCCRCSRERNVIKNQRSGSSESISATNVTEVGVNAHTDATVQCTDQERLKEGSKYRTRLKSSSRIRTDKRDNRLYLTKSLCHKVKAVLVTKKIMCQLVVLFIVLLCGGVFMLNLPQEKHHHSDHSDSSKQEHTAGLTFQDYIDSSETHQDSGDSRIIMDLPFKSVPIKDFERHALSSKSSADMMRIFFDEPLTEEQVNTVLQMKANPYLYSVDNTKYPVDTDIAADASSQSDADAMRQNLMDTAINSVCRDPKPEVHRVENTDASVIRHYYPQCTVLHRCHKTAGCCGDGEVCGPKKGGEELITKYFLVVEVDPTGDGERIRPTSKNFYKEMHFVNHTACECQPIKSEKTNCHKKCPEQFAKRRTGVDCVCACHKKNPLCHKMMHGRTPIAESDLECIKSDKCLPPSCSKGKEFKITNGFCTRAAHRRRHGRRHG